MKFPYEKLLSIYLSISLVNPLSAQTPQAKLPAVPVRPVSITIETAIYGKPLKVDRDIYKIKTEIIKHAKNNDELSNAYYCLADVLLKNADYSDAVFIFKKVDSLTILTKNEGDRIMANLFLASTYNKLSLKKQSEECFAVAEKLVKKLNIPDATMQILDHQSSLLEENMQWCDALHVKKSLVGYFENKIKEGKEERYKINLAIINSQLAYIVLKCNNDLNQAKIYLQRYEETFRHFPADKDNLLSQYYIDKGIISAEENDMEKAKYWFDLAYESAESKNLETLRLRCMEEQIKYGFLDNESKKAYLEAYLLKKNELKKHAEKVIGYEQQLLMDNESERTKRNTLLIAGSFILVLTAVLLYNRKRQTKLKKRFEEIIDNIKQEKKELVENKTIFTQNEKQVAIDTKHSTQPDSKSIMSEEKEKELLAKIEEFEKTELFTDEKFTMAKYALALESNAKYINYVLQKHKGNTFSDYLNELRVKYIVNKLVEHPEYLNYKIGYLAKVSGFNSHSRFTHIFKNVLNISPSEFISQLNRQNKNGK
ncbi:helix-turn-helix domain-containing protein [Chryseobacterium indologenes]|uniref:helix-turn-helix domain-containing protein n=1 Tax=Chryseobacterium indologenes TaxID=253 RepID=UPI001625EEE4|nr:helix-turn-helix domain-containing protein [Chryseobacterium indologenes]